MLPHAQQQPQHGKNCDLNNHQTTKTMPDSFDLSGMQGAPAASRLKDDHGSV
jgi:hypothetical protein